MNKLLKEIFETKIYNNSRGERVEVHSETNEEQCQFLQKIIQEHQCKTTLEIGLAYGMSALAMVEEVAKNNGTHIVVEVGQKYWGNNGLDLLEQTGYMDSIRYIEEYSYNALPKLLAEGTELDLAYIDSTKLMDYLMVDYFYIDKMLKIGGFLIFDDVTFSSIRQLMRYLVQLPHYEVYSTLPENSPIQYSKFKQMIKRKILEPSEFLDKTDYEFGINTHCVALVKKGKDERNWDWHKRI